MKIIIHSKEDKFTLSDLSELCYNINNIYKILVFDKDKKKSLKYYYRAKLPQKDALIVNKISKQSPFSLEISSAITYADIIQTLIGIIGIAIAIRQNRTNRERKITNQEINEEIRIQFRERNIEANDELVAEVRKLSKRKIRIEEIRER
ncbi:MAG: hypothetical protein KJ561_07660 [Nanoarchaeota archaeon]|nr:hypothetical protein [Nanoarchaeota archaeon]